MTLLALLASGCGRPHPDDGDAVAEAQGDREDRIFCAHGTVPLQRTCTVEQTQGQGGLVLTLRHADGGFRRLRVTRDGRGVVAADGADVARVAVIAPGAIEVTLGNDRYRLPATIKPSAA